MQKAALPHTSETFTQSDNAQRVGVLFVHGVGQTAHSDTLIDFGEAFAGWVSRWRRAHGQEPRYGEAELSFSPYDAGSDNSVPYAEMVAPDGATWVLAEAWWAGSTRPIPLTQMLAWSGRHLWSLVLHLAKSIARRLDRVCNKSDYDAGLIARLVDIANCFGLLLLYPLIGLAGYLLLLPVAILAQIPYPPLQNFVLLTLFRPFLQYNASELRVYVEDEIQAANMRRRVADAVDWLTDAARGDCQGVVLIAHSGGAWVTHGMLTDPTYSAQRDRVRKLVTLGSGLNKVWEIAPELQRLHRPLEKDIYWVDFWSSYDPVPAGWLEPPRQGTGWFPIYAPSQEFARKHGLVSRVNPRPWDQQPGWNPNHPPEPEVGGHFWPESIRVVNFMDALTDHGGYFKNDEEVLRRVAAEIDADLYEQSSFWTGPDGQVDRAIPRRRARVAWLATVRIVAVVIAMIAAALFAGPISDYLPSIGLVRGPLGFAGEIQRLLGNVPVVGQLLAAVWSLVVSKVILLLAIAIASLAGLVPFEFFRAGWDSNDLKARNALLKEPNSSANTRAARCESDRPEDRPRAVGVCEP